MNDNYVWILVVLLVPVIFITIEILFIWWGYSIGKRKGFNPTLSGIAVLFFSIIAIIVLYFRRPKKDEYPEKILQHSEESGPINITIESKSDSGLNQKIYTGKYLLFSGLTIYLLMLFAVLIDNIQK